MALIHKATLAPSKIELLAGWLPGRPWAGDVTGVASAGAYRFDDPSGAVGIESFVLRTGTGSLLHVPLTYRAEPLAGAEDHLVGTTEHSVLGRRWVYDGCGDPVWASALATVVLAGGTEVEEFVQQEDGSHERREPTAAVSGSGTPGTDVPAIETVTSRDDGPATIVQAVAADGQVLELLVARVIGAAQPGREGTAAGTLTGRWADGGPAVLASVHRIGADDE